MKKFLKKIDNFIVDMNWLDILLMILVIVFNFIIATVCANHGLVGLDFIIVTFSYYLEVDFIRILVDRFIDNGNVNIE